MLVLKQIIQRNVFRLIRGFTTSAKLSHGDLVVHRDSPDNNEHTPFEFTEANMYRIATLVCYNYPKGYERCALIAALDLVQRQVGWVPISAMNRVAEILHVPRIRVYEAATFYTMTKRRYRGKFHVKVCGTTPCMLRGAEAILAAAEQFCDCKDGGTSPDGMFGVDTVECAGACVNACVVVVNDDYYEDVTVDSLKTIIECLRNGGIPRQGPQSCRFASEPICGLTTLTTPPPGPGYCVQKSLLVPGPCTTSTK